MHTLSEVILATKTIIASVQLQGLPWPREENDKDMIAELESRGYIVIPMEDILDAGLELLDKFHLEE